MTPERFKKIKLVGLASVVGILAITLPNHQAHASFFDITGIVGGVIGYIAYVLIYIITTLAGLFIALITYLISVILQLSNNVVNTLSVQQGFGVTLSIANLGFILAIIIIALATILRRETYGIKKVLWRLIVAAILVNFSLIIGGVIINFTNILTNTFLTALPGGGGGNGPLVFAQSLAGSFAPQRALLNFTVSGNAISGSATGGNLYNAQAGSDLASLITPLISIVFAAGFLVVIVITLAVFLFELLVRYIALAVLLILMPLAWLMWLFPKTSHLFSKWWSEFIRWSFFAPIVIFFLYLAIATAQAFNPAGSNGAIFSGDLSFLQGSQYTPQGSGIFTQLSAAFSSFIGSFATTLLQGILVIGLAYGGMMAADRMSIMGSKVAVSAAKTVGTKTKDYAWKKSSRVVGDRIRTAGTQYNPATKETTTWLQRQGSKMQGIPGLRRAGASVAKSGSLETVKETRKDDIKGHVDQELKSLDHEGIIRRATSSTVFLDPTKAAAIAQELARRNLTNDARIAPLMDRFIQAAGKVGNLQNVLNNRPDLVPRRPGESLEDALKRAVDKIKVADITQIDHHVLGDSGNPLANPTPEQINIALNLSNPQLGKLGTEGESDQIEAFRHTVRQALDQFTAGHLVLNTKQSENLQRIIDYTNNNPNWQNI